MLLGQAFQKGKLPVQPINGFEFSEQQQQTALL